MNIRKMNKGLDFLREKYGAAKGEIALKDGHCYVGATPLLPGRMERKIVELKKMTENGTLEGVSTLRFAAFAPKGTDLQAMLAKELDLAAYLGAAAEVDHSVVTRGCEVEGTVRNSVLSQRCAVGEGAAVDYSILMPGAVVERGAKISYAILGENVRVGAEARIGAAPEDTPPEEWGITVVGPDASVESGRVLRANRMLNREGKETVR